MSGGITTRVGRYEVIAEVGRGAMGVVYEARDPRIDRIVALKTISITCQDPAEESDYRERFLLEAKAVGRLSHPGIVTIFDAGEDAETREPYIAMEYVPGQSLHTILAQRDEKLPLDSALQIAQEIAEALDYAHCQGVVHRDIKPANILITPDGHAKIADFGIAKLNLTQTTLPGEVLGSPAYMAPEQLRGDGVDPRSDLFSAGVILYNMLTGFRPFQGDSATTICYKVVNRNPIYVSAFDATFPPELDRIVSKAIAKTPADRFQTGRELADAISELRNKEAGRQNADFLKEVIEQHNLVPVFRELSSQAGIDAPAGGQAKPKKNAGWVKAGIWGAVALLSITAATGAALLWRSRTSPAASITLFQTIAAPTLTPRILAPPDAALLSSAKKPVDTELKLQIEHEFASGKLWLRVDNKLICKRQLHNESKRHALFFKTIQPEAIDLTVPAGEHHVEIRVQSAAAHYDQSKKIIENFDSKNQNVLHIHCDRTKNTLEATL